MNFMVYEKAKFATIIESVYKVVLTLENFLLAMYSIATAVMGGLGSTYRCSLCAGKKQPFSLHLHLLASCEEQGEIHARVRVCV